MHRWQRDFAVSVRVDFDRACEVQGRGWPTKGERKTRPAKPAIANTVKSEPAVEDVIGATALAWSTGVVHSATRRLPRPEKKALQAKGF
jgi:hypothetical protein